MHSRKSLLLSTAWLLLALTLTGCATSTVRLQHARADNLPALPAQARASLVTTPSACLPNCLTALMEERKQSRDTLTASGLLASPASEPTTR